MEGLGGTLALLSSPYSPSHQGGVADLSGQPSQGKAQPSATPSPTPSTSGDPVGQVQPLHCDPALKFPSPGVSGRGVGWRVAIPKHIPALPSVIFQPLGWPTSALASWTPFPGAFQIQQKHFVFPGKQN